MTYLRKSSVVINNARLVKSAVLIILVSPFAMANTVVEELSMCAKNVDSLQRLVCYDTLATKIKNTPPKLQAQPPVQTTPAGSLVKSTLMERKDPSKPRLVTPKKITKSPTIILKKAVSKADTISQQQAIFGQENKQSTKDIINQIKSTILKVQKDRFGNQTISLANGQVWRQTDSTRLKLKKDQIVIIKRGAMSSFFIGKEDANKRIRAKRVK